MKTRRWLNQLQYLAKGGGLKWKLDELQQIALRHEIARVHQEIRQIMPDNLLLGGFKVFSQTDEDGIIQAIFARIGADKLSKTFIEIGCADGLENNTHALALQEGYRGFWVDASAEKIGRLESNVPSLAIPSSRLKVEQHFVDLDNIEAVVTHACKHVHTTEPDLFSLDIDGNDLVVLQSALRFCSPKVLCVEYNPKFPPPIRMSVPYLKNFSWSLDDYHGASLQSFCDLLTDYRLVCCNLSGANAFFVRTNFTENLKLYAPSQLYQPPRYHLIYVKSGHTPTYKWLESSLRA